MTPRARRAAPTDPTPTEPTHDAGGGAPTGAPDGPTAALTGPVEDYLKAIYDLERAGGAAGTNDLAARLRVAPASVTGMVRRLAEQGLLEYERYRGARLTDAGRRAALRTLRRHRVLEAYLATVLGYPWDRVHAEAERLEHAASDELVDRMAAALGDPAFDPHGAPIPTRDGTVAEGSNVRLTDLLAGERARVVRVADEDGALLRQLDAVALRPGAELELLPAAGELVPGEPASEVADGATRDAGSATAAVPAAVLLFARPGSRVRVGLRRELALHVVVERLAADPAEAADVASSADGSAGDAPVGPAAGGPRPRRERRRP